MNFSMQESPIRKLVPIACGLKKTDLNTAMDILSKGLQHYPGRKKLLKDC